MSEGSKAPIWILVAIGGCGCLVALTAIAGVIAALVIPNLVDATGRAKQARTVADLRNVGVAWESWLVDRGGDDVARELPVGTMAPERLSDLLTPVHATAVPTVDGWGHPLEYAILPSESLERPRLQIRSPGRDGVFEPPPERDTAFTARDFDRDLVWRDGRLVQYPAPR
jgi:hypothetical protein